MVTSHSAFHCDFQHLRSASALPVSLLMLSSGQTLTNEAVCAVWQVKMRAVNMSTGPLRNRLSLAGKPRLGSF